MKSIVRIAVILSITAVLMALAPASLLGQEMMCDAYSEAPPAC